MLERFLRTRAAAGITQVVCSIGTAAIWSPKVLRSAQGAHFVLQIHEATDLVALLTQASGSQDRLPVLATALDASVSLFETTLPEQAIWMFGHEGQGSRPIYWRWPINASELNMHNRLLSL